MGIKIGLDIGVASVGWAVVDDEYTVLENGVNLFSEAAAANNETRRSMRGTRRLIRRRKTRIADFNKLWLANGFDIPDSHILNIVETEVRALSEAVSSDELYDILKAILKHRGISYLEDGDVKGSSEYAEGIKRNQNELMTKLPCEIQLERLRTYGFYRGQSVVEDAVISNVFTLSKYREQAAEILETQLRYNDRLTEDFAADFMELFNRKRAYYDGPGNEKSRTDYGKYTTKRDENGHFITEENIFEKLIGTCSVYPSERRASGASYTAQEYNCLSDLNNLKVNGEPLTRGQKIEIIDTIKQSNTVNMRKIIKNVIGEEITSFEGARIDANEKEIFHTFEAYRKMKKELGKAGFDVDALSAEELDAIANVLTICTDKDQILNAFENRFFDLPQTLSLSDEVKNVLVDIRKKNPSLFSRYQSFSIKVMREDLIPAMYEENKNQMQILTEMGVFKKDHDDFKGRKYIPTEVFTEEIYNPVVVRSARAAVKIINALIKKYPVIDEIIIEMPRDKNSDEEKDRIRKQQRLNENEIKDIRKKISDQYGFEIKEEHFKNHKGLTLKLKLWNEQEGKCLYSGKAIDIRELVENQNAFEVDHIIPLSISLDDSRNNKALVYAIENQRKGNRTPYQYLNTKADGWAYEEYRQMVLRLPYKPGKRRNLLFEEDITKLDVVQGFIHRNLTDTAYASRVVLNTLQDFFKANEAETKVSVIRGAFTHQMRVNLKLDKYRDEDYSHHAVDAMLIAYSKMGYNAWHRLQGEVIDFETGEILRDAPEKLIDDDTYKKILYEEKWYAIRQEITRAQREIKYHFYVDRKINRGLCNQTIRGSRTIDGTTYKINYLNIYKDFKLFDEKIKNGKEDSFLMKRNDPKTWEALMQIYEEYQDAANPFVEYQKETGDYVRKYAKKHNGPKVEVLKYKDGEVGSCIDISHKYGHERGSKKVFLEQLVPYRTDVYRNEKTGKYYLAGLKYSDFLCTKDGYKIDEDAYTKVLMQDKVIAPGQNREDLAGLGYVYQFSLFKNDIIVYEKDGELYKERFLSRTMPKQFNYIETKPLDAKRFEGKDRNLVGLSKTTHIHKINTDVLGNEYVVYQEKMPNI